MKLLVIKRGLRVWKSCCGIVSGCFGEMYLKNIYSILSVIMYRGLNGNKKTRK